MINRQTGELDFFWKRIVEDFEIWTLIAAIINGGIIFRQTPGIWNWNTLSHCILTNNLRNCQTTENLKNIWKLCTLIEKISSQIKNMLNLQIVFYFNVLSRQSVILLKSFFHTKDRHSLKVRNLVHQNKASLKFSQFVLTLLLKKSTLSVICLWNTRPLNGSKLILNVQGGHSNSFKINFESFRTYWSHLNIPQTNNW